MTLLVTALILFNKVISMTFQDLYPGQRVRILSWDELNSIGQYHFNGLLLPDRSIFNNKMKYLCGVTATVTDHIRFFLRIITILVRFLSF